nr:RNA polymerase [Flumine tombus-like virus 61]
MVAPGDKFGLHNNSINNLERGVLERVIWVEKDGKFVSTPPIQKHYFAKVLRRELADIRSRSEVTPSVTGHEFAEMYTGRRRKLNLEAADSLRITPIQPHDSRKSVFVKAEKVDPKKAPRVISPDAGRRLLVAMGRYLKVIEEKMYHVLDAICSHIPTVMKGYNAREIGKFVEAKWNRFSDPVAIGLDAVKFDKHVSVDALEYEHSTYEYFFTEKEWG